MLHPRNLIIFAGVLLLLFGGWSVWRASQPQLSDEEQIAANIETLRRAVQSRNTGRIMNYLADDFTHNGQNKRELNSQLIGTFLQWRDITANVTGLRVSVDGDSAISTGKFSLAFRASQHSRRAEAYLGDFELTWQKRNGQWQITKLKAGEKNDS